VEVWLEVKAIRGRRAEGGLQLLPRTRTNKTRGTGIVQEARRLRLEIDEETRRMRFLSIALKGGV